MINQRIERRRREESKASSNFRLNPRILSYISGGGGLWKQAACLWLQGLRVESTLRYSDNYLSSRVFRTQCHRSRLVHGEGPSSSLINLVQFRPIDLSIVHGGDVASLLSFQEGGRDALFQKLFIEVCSDTGSPPV